ncbi:precorrin-2 C(20)-methyltransferase [Roseospira marina]|uniref:Precorrin-2 C(20)-methyltransferase n=1 Tax=Roseospira marina TaxID=140057 RepID=A0A5M6IDZ8_9PROT|nr:precorrin-2 C(20)-methyltransferase [Roseospira marina]KAA5606187.1 precorrin-2 C(20)-methyltransferase [Roseospira marina]MBB4314331.1 precorrin-2/cobalt-factor-2 C20-methyltransferase [Roseospira marina]MBB5087491.1 precorrin-2/cobalt-factor-2 C20-methyltransferase [Roseospira marina]
MSEHKGRLFGLGVGPGDPELITVKALNRLRAADVVAFPSAEGRKGHALTITEGYLRDEQVRLPMVFPVTIEAPPPPFDYEAALAGFYDGCAEQIAGHLDAGRDVAVLCEGDPFFYGSYMYLHDRLADRYETEVVPGVCSILAGASVLGTPLVYRDQYLSVLSGVMTEDDLRRRLTEADAAAIMKLGKTFTKVRRVIEEVGLLDRALYVERATMTTQRTLPLADVDPATVPYFSVILIPGRTWVGSPV